jgi:3-deoxy-7-phosphoheptulonate synthase
MVNTEDVDLYANMRHPSARNMQNFALLKKLGGVGKPVMLKRDSATIRSF